MVANKEGCQKLAVLIAVPLACAFGSLNCFASRASRDFASEQLHTQVFFRFCGLEAYTTNRLC